MPLSSAQRLLRPRVGVALLLISIGCAVLGLVAPGINDGLPATLLGALTGMTAVLGIGSLVGALALRRLARAPQSDASWWLPSRDQRPR